MNVCLIYDLNFPHVLLSLKYTNKKERLSNFKLVFDKGLSLGFQSLLP